MFIFAMVTKLFYRFLSDTGIYRCSKLININLITAFSVVVGEPKVEVIEADGSIIKETTQTTTQTTTKTTEKNTKTTQKTEKTTQKTTMNDRKTMEKNAKATQKTTEKNIKTTEKNTRTTQKTTEKILETIKGNPSASRAILAEVCGISQDGIKWQLKKLQDQGVIRRVGPDKGGHWEIVRSEENE